MRAEHWLGAYDDRAPDLVAEWKLTDRHGDVKVTVRALSPAGCKIDPRTKFTEGERPRLHPECAAVLRDLEELDRAAG